MPEQDKPIVINDRRRFRDRGDAEEQLNQEPQVAGEAPGESTPEPAQQAELTNSAHLITPMPTPGENAPHESAFAEDELAADSLDGDAPAELPPPPTPEEIEQVRAAYQQTAERIDTMMRSQNLGAEHLPPMDFKRLVQSVYMSAMIQLGAGTQQGQQARVDLIGATQSIDMLNVISEKARGNLSEDEDRLLQSALFELRMGFLEITQLLARQAASKQQAAPAGQTGAGTFGGGGFTGAGPRIVR